MVVSEAEKLTGQPLNGRTRLTKLVFLLQSMKPAIVEGIIRPGRDYPFVPYKFGPFSQELLSDLDQLKANGLLRTGIRDLDSKGFVVERVYELTPEGRRFLWASLPSSQADTEARRFLDEFLALSRSELVSYVYRRFPAFVSHEQ